MLLHLLITPHIQPVPESIKVVQDFGQLTVSFDGDDKGESHIKNGLHAIVEGEKEDILNWLRPFDYFVVGSGTPMFEEFTIQHIAKN